MPDYIIVRKGERDGLTLATTRLDVWERSSSPNGFQNVAMIIVERLLRNKGAVWSPRADVLLPKHLCISASVFLLRKKEERKVSTQTSNKRAFAVPSIEEQGVKLCAHYSPSRVFFSRKIGVIFKFIRMSNVPCLYNSLLRWLLWNVSKFLFTIIYVQIACVCLFYYSIRKSKIL